MWFQQGSIQIRRKRINAQKRLLPAGVSEKNLLIIEKDRADLAIFSGQYFTKLNKKFISIALDTLIVYYLKILLSR